jgi:hypothetical protein
MLDNRGSAVAIVMLVLAIVSLIGVTLLTRSKLHMQFVASSRVYDDLVNLADGRVAEALRQFKSIYTYKVPGDAFTAGSEPNPSGFALVNAPMAIPPVGYSASQTKFVRYALRPASGWQKGSAPDGYHEEYWVIQAVAWNYAYGVAGNPPQISVSVPLTILRRNY